MTASCLRLTSWGVGLSLGGIVKNWNWVIRRSRMSRLWTKHNTERTIELFNDVIMIPAIIPGWYDVFLYILFLSTQCSSLSKFIKIRASSLESLCLEKLPFWENLKKKFTFLFSKCFPPSLASDTYCGQWRFTWIFQNILIYSKSSSWQYCPQPFSPIF